MKEEGGWWDGVRFERLQTARSWFDLYFLRISRGAW